MIQKTKKILNINKKIIQLKKIFLEENNEH